MNKLVAAILMCLFAATGYAEEVDRTVDAAYDGHVDVSNIAGSVTIRGWQRHEVEVTGTLGRNVEELIVERDGDTVLVKVKVPRKSGRGIESELLIIVPQNSSLDIGTVSADIDVTDVNGEQSLHTVSGNVTTEYTGADMDAQSVSGDVEITGDQVDGEIEASTVSGDVTMFRLAGEIEAASVSGNVIVDEGSFSRAELGTVNGEIIFHAELRDESKFSADTGLLVMFQLELRLTPLTALFEIALDRRPREPANIRRAGNSNSQKVMEAATSVFQP
jgi:hypothetical protein